MNKINKLPVMVLLLALVLSSCATGEFYPLKLDDVYYLEPDSNTLVKYSSESGYTEKELAVIRDEKLTYPELTRKYITLPCGKDYSSTGAVKANIAYGVVDGQVVLATPTQIEAPFEYISIPDDTSRIFIWVGTTGVNLLDLSQDTAVALISDASMSYVKVLDYIKGEGLLYQAGTETGKTSLYIYNPDTAATKRVADFAGREYIKMDAEGGIICSALEYDNGIAYYKTVEKLDVQSGEYTQLYKSTRKGEVFNYIGQNMIYSAPGNGVLEITDYTTGNVEYYDIGAYAQVSYALLSSDGKYLAVYKDLPDASGYIYISLITLNIETGNVKEHYNSAEVEDYSLYYIEWYDANHLIINYLSDKAAKNGYSMIKTISN
ncbi:MAG: hypothetical protein AB9835_00455 [Eubacteriales bacterium]